jgi:hypothetical protein
MFNSWGYGVYFFFASLMVLSIIFIFFLLPETKSIPMEVMDQLFEVKPVWKANDVVMDRLRMQEEQFRAEAGKVQDEKVEVDQFERSS